MDFGERKNSEIRKRLCIDTEHRENLWEQVKVLKDFQAIRRKDMEECFKILERINSEVRIENQTRKMKFGDETYEQFKTRIGAVYDIKDIVEGGAKNE